MRDRLLRAMSATLKTCRRDCTGVLNVLALQRQPSLASKHAKCHLTRNAGKVVHEFRGVLVLAVDVLETLQHQRQRAEQENAKDAGANYIL